MTNNKPTATLRDGPLKATIWKQNSEKGTFYRVNFTRGYRDKDGNWQDSDSFSGAELLQIAHLATKAYAATSDLRAHDSNPTECTPDDGRLS